MTREAVTREAVTRAAVTRYATRVPDVTATHDLLWTSGWDSTFRLLSALLLEDAWVRPHYIVDPPRASTEAELATMTRIRDALAREYPEAAARLLPTCITRKPAIPGLGTTTNRFDALAAKGHLGTQYEWLARYAAGAGLVDLELAIHYDDKAHAHLDGHVVPIRTRSSTVYRLAPDEAGSDLALFGRFSFPVFDLTKLDMQRIAAEKGFADLLELSWFCHRPLRATPCGVCGPCFDAIREGLGHRLPRSSHVRNRIYRVVPWRKVASKLGQLTGRVSVQPA